METNEEVVIDDTLDSSEEVDLNTTQEESIDEIKARLAKAEELATNYKIRAEKAEKVKVKAEPQQSNQPTNKDFIALMNAKVHEDDVSDVEDYARFKGISIAEALKTNTVKTLLAEKQEFRNTALAANTGKARTGNSRISDDTLLDKASKGELPESSDDIARLIKARKGIK